MANFKIKSS